MTIKEIAETAGCGEKVVRKYGKQLFPQQFVNGKLTEFDEVQAIQVMKAIPKRNLVQPRSNDQPQQNIELISRIVAETIKQLLPLIQNQSKQIEDKREVPQKTDRASLSQFVRKYAEKSGRDFGIIWNTLYDEALYRISVNIKICAKNRGMAPLDFAEQEGLLPDLLLIAMEIFK